MSDQMVLVTGAAGGKQGKTGKQVTAMLLERGVRVRAFVHRIDDRAEHLRALGAEVIEGDFLDIQSVQRAVRGVSSIYFAYPVQDGLLDATAIIAIAARDAGITRLINLVMLRSAPDAPTPRMRQNNASITMQRVRQEQARIERSPRNQFQNPGASLPLETGHL